MVYATRAEFWLRKFLSAMDKCFEKTSTKSRAEDRRQSASIDCLRLAEGSRCLRCAPCSEALVSVTVPRQKSILHVKRPDLDLV